MFAGRSLGRRFGPRWVFRGLDFELKPGNVLVVLGQNGSGKSTLLKVMSGLLAPTEGSIERPSEDVRRTLGYMALDLALYPTLSAAEHLEFAGTTRCVAPRTYDLLVQMGLEDAAHQRVEQFSSGMRTRLKLALAVQTYPTVLLLDEPTAGLDNAGREVLDRVIACQRETGVTVLATNDPFDRGHATHELEL